MFSLLLTPCFYSLFIQEFVIFFSFFLIPFFWESSEVCKFYSIMFMTDKLSISLIMLSSWLILLIIYSSTMIMNKSLMNLILLIMHVLLILFFFSSNLINFYIFFELSIIPTMMIIMGWGYQPERLEASFLFFFYTVLASFPLLVSVVWINSFFFFINFSNLNSFFGWMMILAFLVKIPIFFLHSWLPKAHVEAPLVGSMLLAGILLKMGGYGIMRLESIFKNELVIMLYSISILGMMYSSLMSLMQIDMKSLIAYSSVSHMNFLILGLISMKSLSFSGSSMLMISHGLVSSLLFYLSNEMFYLSNSRLIMVNKFNSFFPSHFMMMLFLALLLNLALPPSLGMVSELLISMTMISMWFFSAFFLGIYFFMSAFYSIFFYLSLTHGYLENHPSILCSINLKTLLIFFGHFFPLIMMIFKLEITG
uniref:NADH-ubiquinone oxidoreductase chain 4 n=1 Tax=Ricinus sp. ADS-2020 TaxID=2794903 RepID=A0A7T1HF00_9NEOP|nr:NADH dehydrogenase subunit 4 [Ricinus sp. ADS-2020]